MLDEKVEEIKQRGGMSSGDLDTVNTIVLTMEKIDRMEEIAQNLGGYSMAEGGNAYRNGMGVWSADSGRGMSYRRGRSATTGRYMSRDDGRQQIAADMERVMSQANLDQSQRNVLQQALQALQE